MENTIGIDIATGTDITVEMICNIYGIPVQLLSFKQTGITFKYKYKRSRRVLRELKLITRATIISKPFYFLRK